MGAPHLGATPYKEMRIHKVATGFQVIGVAGEVITPLFNGSPYFQKFESASEVEFQLAGEAKLRIKKTENYAPNAAYYHSLIEELSLPHTELSNINNLACLWNVERPVPTLQSIVVSPSSETIPVGTHKVFAAKGIYSDHSEKDITQQVSWQGSPASFISISDVSGGKAIHGVAVGDTNVSASYLGVTSPSSPVHVSEATLVALAFNPFSASLPKGTSRPLTVTGTFSDGSSMDVTSQVDWQSAWPAILAASNSVPTKGIVTGMGVGSTTVTASWMGIMTQASLTVTAAELVQISLGVNYSLTVSRTRAMNAIGTYTDGSLLDLTSNALWSTSVGAIASVSNAVGSKGLVTGASLGTSEVRASFGGITGATNVTVVECAKYVTPVGASASTTYSIHVANNAIDGNSATAWSSTAYSGWIDIDFGTPKNVHKMKLVVQMLPNGSANHQIHGTQDGVTWTAIGSLVGARYLGEVINVPVNQTYRRIRVNTPSSVSWVGWQDILFCDGSP